MKIPDHNRKATMSSMKIEKSFLLLGLVLLIPKIASSNVFVGVLNPHEELPLSISSPLIPGDTLPAKTDSANGFIDTTISAKDTVTAKKDTLDIIVSTENLNTTSGFRVQLGSTQDLSEAISERAKAENLLADYNVYIIYDSPYYKVRMGDFRVRYDATQAANYISVHGFPDAWVVPDNVFKSPQHKSR